MIIYLIKSTEQKWHKYQVWKGTKYVAKNQTNDIVCIVTGTHS